MPNDFAALARQLAERAEAVCRQYLSNGAREGRYWIVGNAYNTPGRSMFVRLAARDSDKGSVGKWSDAATGERGDLLDVIGLSLGHRRKRDTLAEARRFLSIAPTAPFDEARPCTTRSSRPTGTPEAARRLFAGLRGIQGTLAKRYLEARGIHAVTNLSVLRFHPNCYYRTSKDDARYEGGVAGTDRSGHRYDGHDRRRAPNLDRSDHTRQGTGRDAATRVGSPPRTWRAVRVAGRRDGSRRGHRDHPVCPHDPAQMPMIAALSSAHLGALAFPPTLRRLYVARDNDRAGEVALARLRERAEPEAIEIIPLVPDLLDFNDDLRLLPAGSMKAALRRQLLPEDRRFLFNEFDDLDDPLTL